MNTFSAIASLAQFTMLLIYMGNNHNSSVKHGWLVTMTAALALVCVGGNTWTALTN
jgi:hypothetical protein